MAEAMDDLGQSVKLNSEELPREVELFQHFNYLSDNWKNTSHFTLSKPAFPSRSWGTLQNAMNTFFFDQIQTLNIIRFSDITDDQILITIRIQHFGKKCN